MTLARPELIFFDLGDTLVRAHPGWSDVYLEACRAEGIEVDPQQLSAALVAAASEGAWDSEGPFEATEAGSFARIRAADQDVFDRLGHHDLPDAFFRSVETAFARRSSWHIFPDVLPALEALAAAGVRRAVISNWLWGGVELMHELELASHFEALVISARVGWNKPAVGIFSHALEVTSVAPERCVHVGDSYRNDVLGAYAAGIEPVLIDRRGTDPARLSSVVGDDPVPVVRDLWELLDLVDVPRPSAAPG